MLINGAIIDNMDNHLQAQRMCTTADVMVDRLPRSSTDTTPLEICP